MTVHRGPGTLPIVAAREPAQIPRRKAVPERTRTAYHEAGHAVLSAALNDTPSYVSIRAKGDTLGRNGMKMTGRPTWLVQVALAGYAAEHLLTGRRSLQCKQEIGLGILAHVDPELGTAMPSATHCDGYLAVQRVLSMVGAESEDELRVEIERFYEIARESLSKVWPAVAAVAKALLERQELDRNGLDVALEDFDIYSAVFAVQRRYGLLAAPP
jgi:ATP-dependent Zn protease